MQQTTHTPLIGYLLWLFGFTGAHRFYYGKPISGTIYFFTLGLFFIGWLVDLLLIPGMDRQADLRFSSGPIDYNKFVVLITAEPSDTTGEWSGPIVLRGQSPSTRMLPPDILERKKRGFGTPMGAWLKADLKPLLARMLDEPTVARRALFDYAQVRTLVADHEANRIDGTDQLLALMNLEIWARLFLDGAP